MAMSRTKLKSEVSTWASKLTEKMPFSVPLLKGSIRLSFLSPLSMWYIQMRAPHPEIVSMYTYLLCRADTTTKHDWHSDKNFTYSVKPVRGLVLSSVSSDRLESLTYCQKFLSALRGNSCTAPDFHTMGRLLGWFSACWLSSCSQRSWARTVDVSMCKITIFAS